MPLVEGEANIGSNEGEFAHGEVEDAGAFIDEGPTQSHQGINASD
jgi:hypothetical protein